MASRKGFPVLLLCLAVCAPRAAAADEAVYADALGAAWTNWSWNTTVNTEAASPVHGGARSLSARHNAAWAGLYLHTDTALPGASFDRLRFWLHGGAVGGQSISVTLFDGSGNPAGDSVAVTATAASWTLHEISFTDLGDPADVSGIVWQDATGGAQPVFYLDDVVVVARTGPAPPPPLLGGPALAVDAAAGRRPISPDIYGMNWADEALAAELRLPVRRWGGNSVTRYNWQNDTSNHASDWYFENIPNDNDNPALLPSGSSSDQFVEQDRRTGTRSLITVPLIGWTPKARAWAGGFAVAKYGAQQSVDPWHPEYGNGVRTDGTTITGNDPADTSVAATPAFVQQWIAHLKGRFGAAASGGVGLYNLDNEPELWTGTHRDVRPAPLGYDETRDLTYQYAAAVKAADPGALTLGPVSWGWTAYFYSNLDWAGGGAWWSDPPDRNAHGGVPFVEWYLQQMRAYEQTTGTRILDYLDLHYYPQASGVALSSAGSAATRALRLRSTRSLWDPTYTDESWIGEAVGLMPRMREWVRANYPGTKLAVTEYNWGGHEHINGALAQADVLGIFGREGLDLACLWDPPSAGQPAAFAFRMYRNYDGSGGAFGDTAVETTSTDRESLAAYCAQRGPGGPLTLVVINKTASDLESTLTLAGFAAAGAAEVYRYSAAAPAAIVRAPDQTVSAGGFTAVYPQSSITLIVLAPLAARVENPEDY